VKLTVGAKNMKRFIILVISTLLSACSLQGIFATPIPSSTAIQAIATSNTEVLQSTLTPISTKTVIPIPSKSAELDFELPPDCSTFDSSIDPVYYHDLSNGACNHPALSPGESHIAYASLTITDAGKIVQEARLFSKSLSESFPIYTSRCGILRPEWTPIGYLVISDSPQDVGCGYTVIYDTAKGEILAVLNGAVSRSGGWSSDRNSFFTVSPQLFGPECSEILSGFDFISSQPIPTIKPIMPNTNIYVVIGDPIWSVDNKNLSAVLRDGICSNPENNECTYSNSYIISIAFSKTTPVITYPHYDAAIDYSFAKSNEGKLEIHSVPSKVVNCQEVEKEESK
jgi:hypothetical protein